MRPEVHIVGRHTLQNELMARFLSDTAGLSCACHHETAFPELLRKKENGGCLILRDSHGMALHALWEGLSGNSTCLVALFNFKGPREREKRALYLGVRGVFFENDPMPTITRGVQAILEGELWFSRQTLIQCVLERKQRQDPLPSPAVQLTSREREVLGMIAGGATNSRIADALGISVHTVKTHLYNAYRKAEVSNRLQAALWAAKNL